MRPEPNAAPMILRRLRPVALARPIHSHTHFHLAPRLNFTVVHSSAPVETLRVERILRTTAGERLVERQELVRRIAEQGARRDYDRTPASTTPTAAPARVLGRGGVPAVLLRSAAPVPAVPQVPAPPAAERSWAPAAPSQVPSLDLDRLSEQVIQKIDRRVQAHRERIGRR